MRPTKRLTHGMIDKDRPGGPDILHNVAGCANGQGRNILGFNEVSDKTHGLVAVGSVGYEHSQINVFTLQLTYQSRGKLFLDLSVETDPAIGR